jgi:23S rRNA pseudouridine2605 synthase
LTYVALHKPRFVLSTVEKELDDNRETVIDLIEVRERVYPVGRLDLESEGLVLLTNDGDLANRLTHPRYGHMKEYRVLLARRPDDDQLSAWRRGVILEDGYKTQPADVRLVESQGKGAWLRIVMGEGRKRQIREIAAQLGLPVVRIVRTRISSLKLGRMKPREWRFLTKEEVEFLKNPEKEKEAREERPKTARKPSSSNRPPSRSSNRPPSRSSNRPPSRSSDRPPTRNKTKRPAR